MLKKLWPSRVNWKLIYGGWTLCGLFFASQSLINQAYSGRGIAWVQTLVAWLCCSYIWATLTPFILSLGRRFPIERNLRFKALATHIICAFFFSCFSLLIYVFVHQFLMGSGTRPFAPIKSLQSLLIAEFHAGILYYFAIIGIDHTLDYYRRLRERELTASQLETRLAQAQLEALKMQLHPHFLFNTLNTISVLMQEDAKAANEVLVRLSDLLRITLESQGTHEVSLKQELEFLEGYLDIERVRFQDRLSVNIKVDPSTLDARVPNLLLQPLVENAIRHGIAPRSTPGSIEILAERRDGRLRLEVSDDGPGLKNRPQGGSRKKIGLSNTQERLKQLYGESQNFELSNIDDGGLRITITIPFNTENSTHLEHGGKL